jgi:hypothetical protein
MHAVRPPASAHSSASARPVGRRLLATSALRRCTVCSSTEARRGPRRDPAHRFRFNVCVSQRFAVLCSRHVTKRCMDPPNIALYIAQLLGMCNKQRFPPPYASVHPTMIGDIQELHNVRIYIVLNHAYCAALGSVSHRLGPGCACRIHLDLALGVRISCRVT